MNTDRACDHSCVLFAVNLDYYIHCFIHQFFLQLVMTSCGFVFNYSYHNIIDYRDNLARILWNIVIMFFGFRTGLTGSHYKLRGVTIRSWCRVQLSIFKSQNHPIDTNYHSSRLTNIWCRPSNLVADTVVFLCVFCQYKMMSPQCNYKHTEWS